MKETSRVEWHDPPGDRHTTQAVHAVLETVRWVCARHTRPVVVALDGGSGAGKSTLAGIIRQRISAALVPLDDFYNAAVPETEWTRCSVEERLRLVFDWERVRRDALLPLRETRPGRWHAFDFASGMRPDGTYGFRREATEVAPAPVIFLEGTYSAAPVLADLVDLSVLVDTPLTERHRRTEARDETAVLEKWHAIWDEVEIYYFTRVRPPHSFDLVVTTAPKE